MSDQDLPEGRKFVFVVNTQDDETELMALLAQAMQSYKDISQEGRLRVVHWFLDRYSPMYFVDSGDSLAGATVGRG